MSPYHFLGSIALAAILAGCGGDAASLAAQAQNLAQRDKDWAELATAGKDVEKTASYWSDGAVIIPPGQPVISGKAAIRAFVTSSFQTPGFKIHWQSDPPVLSPDGRLAYMRSFNTMSVPGPNGTAITLQGRGLTVWRLEADGVWRCTVDIWNDPPGPADASK